MSEQSIPVKYVTYERRLADALGYCWGRNDASEDYDQPWPGVDAWSFATAWVDLCGAYDRREIDYRPSVADAWRNVRDGRPIGANPLTTERIES